MCALSLVIQPASALRSSRLLRVISTLRHVLLRSRTTQPCLCQRMLAPSFQPRLRSTSSTPSLTAPMSPTKNPSTPSLYASHPVIQETQKCVRLPPQSRSFTPDLTPELVLPQAHLYHHGRRSSCPQRVSVHPMYHLSSLTAFPAVHIRVVLPRQPSSS